MKRGKGSLPLPFEPTHKRMDLENFDRQTQSPDTPKCPQSAREAVEHLDQHWYRGATRRARWMDLVGDYAGSEPLVIDGDALIQNALNDPLLKLGDEDLGFQVLHAVYNLEKILDGFIQRSANITVVFWDCNNFARSGQTSTLFMSSASALARKLLFNHVIAISRVDVHVFQGLSDPEWLAYEAATKPMLVITNDGGVATSMTHSTQAQAILMQRLFIYNVLASKIAVSLLNTAQFRDSKIFSFVFEQRGPQTGVLPKASDRFLYQAHALRRTSLVGAFMDLDVCCAAIAAAYASNEINVHAFKMEFLFLFLLHLILVPTIPLEQRARPASALPLDLIDVLREDFLPAMLETIADVIEQHFVDIDGHLFQCLIHFCLIGNLDSSELLCQSVGEIAYNRVARIWLLCELATPRWDAFMTRYPVSSSPAIPALPVSSASVVPSLLAFSNPLFDEQLSIVAVSSTAQEMNALPIDTFGQSVPFTDDQHWHNGQTILPVYQGGAPPPTKTAWQKSRELRATQRFMATLERQAATLTGALGRSFNRIVIMPASETKSKTPPAHVSKKQEAKSNKPPKKAVIKKADIIRQQNTAQKRSDQDVASTSWWQRELNIMSKISVPADKMKYLKHLFRNPKSTEAILRTEMLLYDISLQITDWTLHKHRDIANVQDRYTVSLLCSIKTILDIRCEQEYLSLLTLKIVCSVLVALGFHEFAAHVRSERTVTLTSPRSLSFEFPKMLRSRDNTAVYTFMTITEPIVVWQLRLFGEFMDRSMDSAPDGRVSFHPDAWQRRVLDCIDHNESVLVAAPTSAGKTFISFYAMEKVLRGSDDGVIVYIAPTKALVTQIAAEIHARFSKSLKDKSCWAVHTRDWRIHNPHKCQILVTVPEMLAIMLLSPPLAKLWTPRIQRIILDEIHSIGQQEGGAVWEQIILLAPCPIIGLSATIGDASKFNTWIESVQTAHGFKHTFVEHPHRYSHLRKFWYAIQTPTSTASHFPGLGRYQPTDRTRFLHPISTLSFGARSLPTDLALEAQDTLSLYRALARFRSSFPGIPFDHLEPTRYFRNVTGLFRQSDVLRYEADLKEVLVGLMTIHDIRDTSSPLYNVIQCLQDPTILDMPPAILNNAPTRTMFRENLIRLLADLQVANSLPAILFNFDRTECEIIATVLLTVLQESELEWQSQSPEWTRKLKAWQFWNTMREKQGKARGKVKKAGKRGIHSDDDDIVDENHVGIDNSWEQSFNPNDPLPEFSFAGTPADTSYSQTELQEDIAKIAWCTPNWALEALRRGIAVHHAGMNKQYRSLVESLFRQGYVRVMIATGTLALGINAPAKTAVFCGDSPFLTALMYRQCAGRAGRRGYDLLGNVIFYGLPMDRVQRLILSKLPALSGNFPLTSTLTLRLFNLLNGSDNAEVARRAVSSLMSLPHVSFASETGRHQLLHHVRFSIEYLRRASLLDRVGRPKDFFAIAAHLYYTEPSNFALVALLQHGGMHDICRHSHEEEAQKTFVMVMAHLFGRRYIHSAYASTQNIAILTRKYPSMVVLPPLSSAVRTILVQHDQDILEVFTKYALTYASSYVDMLGVDTQLPLSKKVFAGTVDDIDSPFREHLHTSTPRIMIRSLFVAISGHLDTYKSVDELTRTARQNLHLNGHAIPSLNHLHSPELPLNAYLLDFFIHGQDATITSANGIRRGDLWYLFQDFSLVLMTIKAALWQLLIRASKKSQSTEEHDDENESSVDGYEDPAELDREDIEQTADTTLLRPAGVSDEHWRVYEVVSGAADQFHVKFKKMWA